MRSDMQKVIVERPRWGSRMLNRGTARRIRPVEVDEDFDSGSTRVSSAMQDKMFNEHLNPLWRYLRSNLGRPWDKVYSEIRSRIDGRGVLGNHVLDHLFCEVETNCILDGREVRTTEGLRVYGFYVHPSSGLLLEAPRQSWKRKARRYPVRWVHGPRGERYQRFDGLWFQVVYRLEDERPVLASKRQCNKKQVHRILFWIDAAERGKRGYRRDADSVRVPHRFPNRGEQEVRDRSNRFYIDALRAHLARDFGLDFGISAEVAA